MAATLPSTSFIFPAAASRNRVCTIRCGPRNNRGPLLKGRILSTEAIQVIQTLKRSYRTNPSSLPTHILSRLIKSDLIAAFNELIRQDHFTLALEVFSAFRSEYQADFDMYANLVSALSKSGQNEEIDRLTEELEKYVEIPNDDIKGLRRLVKAVIGAGRRESTVKIYGMMKRSGWGSPAFEVDEYLVKVLINGLRGFGEEVLANEVAGTMAIACNGVVVKPRI